MPQLRLTALQFQIMDIFWEQGGLSVREVHGALPTPRPAYTTVQTLIGRLETKGALKRTRKIGNAYLFEASVSRDSVQRRALDEFLALFGGQTKTADGAPSGKRKVNTRGCAGGRAASTGSSKKTGAKKMIQLILDHLWQSTLFVALAAFLTLFFKVNSARVRYGIWLTASLKFLLPLALLTAAGKAISLLMLPVPPPLPPSWRWTVQPSPSPAGQLP